MSKTNEHAEPKKVKLLWSLQGAAINGGKPLPVIKPSQTSETTVSIVS
jgi:hypothetical protein